MTPPDGGAREGLVRESAKLARMIARLLLDEPGNVEELARLDAEAAELRASLRGADGHPPEGDREDYRP